MLPSRSRDHALGRALENLPHYVRTLRTHQRILADEEGRYSAHSALMSRQGVILQAHVVARRASRLGDVAFIETHLRAQSRNERGIANIRAFNEVCAVD